MQTVKFTNDESTACYEAVRKQLELAEDKVSDAKKFPEEVDLQDAEEEVAVLNSILNKLVAKE